MTITYQATLEDMAEPSIRLYLRSKSARNARVTSTITTAIYAATPFILVSFFYDTYLLLFSGFVGALAGALINYSSYISTVKKRITKHIQNEAGSTIPCDTVFSVDDKQLLCTTRGVTLIFQLSDLSLISEDEKRLEIFFEKKGLCVIPLRAFKSPIEKNNFISKIKSEPSGSPKPLSAAG